VALLAEEIVEEWLNRQGYFTIRGIKTGVDELDILAIRPSEDAMLECRHIEVQASVRPVSYISRVPKQVQRETGKAATSSKRSTEELVVGVEEWVTNKFAKPKKLKLMKQLAPGDWSRELVIHRVKSREEVLLIEQHGIVVHHLSTIVRDLAHGTYLLPSASGAHLIDLLHMVTGEAPPDPLEAAVYRPGPTRR
jgi:hypothetical protein